MTAITFIIHAQWPKRVNFYFHTLSTNKFKFEISNLTLPQNVRGQFGSVPILITFLLCCNYQVFCSQSMNGRPQISHVKNGGDLFG